MLPGQWITVGDDGPESMILSGQPIVMGADGTIATIGAFAAFGESRKKASSALKGLVYVSGNLGGMAATAGWDDDCVFCGGDMADPYIDDSDPYTCPYCNAPTPQWWAELARRTGTN